ncbi:ABC transporter substrate-binding protein [Paenibacillus sp. JCM 10914]|uniref:ABC transporter substrate-binding protein n=1 Tax=Paenibacillus sp. JCM 10914 TaxID=1236974 RepID=UPI0003CCADF6|nr:ABC transporter substrate-binding protein [Paenibacillus sp. JCM 10914]GAE06996.1 ABC transporter, substrate-binding protein [Paenibacillus sp. JCM 10914]
MFNHRRLKREWAAFCLVLPFLLLLGGCFPQPDAGTDSFEGKETVNLIYYTIGEPDPDLQLVNDKINEILSRKIGVTITYLKIGWQEYEDRLNTLISAGSPFDIAFAPDYATGAIRGAWLKLDEYLEGIGKDMYNVIDPVFWQGVRMNDGFIYGVPTNKELAVRDHWMYPATIVDRYGIDITRYNTLESLEPLLRMIKRKEPEYLPMELDRDSHNFFALHGYEYVLNSKVPLMVQSLDPDGQVVNIFETQEARQVLDTLRRYYQAGFINEDAALREPGGLKRAKVFWKSSGGGPLSETTWSKDRGYRVVTHPVTPSTVTTESVRGGIMAVNANTKHPVESIRFLNLLNTDPEIRNLFNYGIEGLHYTLNDDGQIVLTPGKDNEDNLQSDIPASRYSGVQYTQGNWFILKTMGGEYPEPLDKWDTFREYNAKLVQSAMLGFTPDLVRLSETINNVEIVWQKYYPSLMTGSVDVEKILPRFNEELHQAGLDEIQAVIQQQLDDWRMQKR